MLPPILSAPSGTRSCAAAGAGHDRFLSAQMGRLDQKGVMMTAHRMILKSSDMTPPNIARSTYGRISPNATFFQTGSASEPYNRGQWGSALRATPQAAMDDVTDGRGLQTTCTFTCPRFPASLASLTD